MRMSWSFFLFDWPPFVFGDATDAAWPSSRAVVPGSSNAAPFVVGEDLLD